jgi:hypothetical protein
MKLLNPRAGKAVEDAELFLAQALVDNKAAALGTNAPFSLNDLSSALRPEIGRGEHHVGTFCCRKGSKPASEGAGLLLAELAEGNIHVSMGNVDM